MIHSVCNVFLKSGLDSYLDKCWNRVEFDHHKGLGNFNVILHLCSSHLIHGICFNINKRASLACAARLADTLCPPETPFGRLGSHWLIIREITYLNMSILVLLKSISLEKSPNLSIIKILMRNDDVITK